MGFIVTDRHQSAPYALTAGHCLDDGVTQVYLSNHEVFGVVEAFENTLHDWGLIRILPQMRSEVSPSVRYWTGPTGVSPPGALSLGATVCIYGQMAGLPEALRDRCGAFTGYGVYSGYDWVGVSGGGDSGSPAFDYATGQALGILTFFGGSTVSGILDRLATFGYDLTLATAPYNPPPPMPI